MIAQCVLAAQETVPDTFTVHSMHCYFVMAGQRTAPVFYHAERVRDGRSIATRTVQARQWGKVIFTTTLSFVIEAIGEEKTLEHSVSIPTALPDPDGEDSADMNTRKLGRVGFMKRTIKTENCKDSLFRCSLCSPYFNKAPSLGGVIMLKGTVWATVDESPQPHKKRMRQWVKANGHISDTGGYRAHVAALAYMSDTSFVGSIPRAHNISFSNQMAYLRQRASLRDLHGQSVMTHDEVAELSDFEKDEETSRGGQKPGYAEGPDSGMMVSLDHTIYFHNPRNFRADEWMFCEIETPWAGKGRGVAYKKIFTRKGVLIATCVQEVTSSPRL